MADQLSNTIMVPNDMNCGPTISLIHSLLGDFAEQFQLNNPGVVDKYLDACIYPHRHYKFSGEFAFKFAASRYLSARFPDLDDVQLSMMHTEIFRLQDLLNCLNERLGSNSIDKDNLYSIIGVAETLSGIDLVNDWAKSILDWIFEHYSDRLFFRLPRSMQRAIKGNDLAAIIDLVNSTGGAYEEECEMLEKERSNSKWRWYIYYKLGPNAAWYGHQKIASKKKNARAEGEQEIMSYYKNDRYILEKHKENFAFPPSLDSISMLPITADYFYDDATSGFPTSNSFMWGDNCVHVPTSPKNATQEEVDMYNENFKRALLGISELTTNERSKKVCIDPVVSPVSPSPLPTRSALEMHIHENSLDNIIIISQRLSPMLKQTIMKDCNQSINLKQIMMVLANELCGQYDTTFISKGQQHKQLHQATSVLTVGSYWIQATKEAPKKKEAELLTTRAILEMLVTAL